MLPGIIVRITHRSGQRLTLPCLFRVRVGTSGDNQVLVNTNGGCQRLFEVRYERRRYVLCAVGGKPQTAELGVRYCLQGIRVVLLRMPRALRRKHSACAIIAAILSSSLLYLGAARIAYEPPIPTVLGALQYTPPAEPLPQAHLLAQALKQRFDPRLFRIWLTSLGALGSFRLREGDELELSARLVQYELRRFAYRQAMLRGMRGDSLRQQPDWWLEITSHPHTHPPALRLWWRQQENYAHNLPW